jgi:hypothetical protein
MSKSDPFDSFDELWAKTPSKKRPRSWKPKRKDEVEIFKPRKKRPYPYWLKPYQFGSHAMNCHCYRCMGSHPLN